jgi:hypothetical protein
MAKLAKMAYYGESTFDGSSLRACADACMQASWTVTSTSGSMRVELSSNASTGYQYFAAVYGTKSVYSNAPGSIRSCELSEVTIAYGSSRFCGIAGTNNMDTFGGIPLLLVCAHMLAQSVSSNVCQHSMGVASCSALCMRSCQARHGLQSHRCYLRHGHVRSERRRRRQ